MNYKSWIPNLRVATSKELSQFEDFLHLIFCVNLSGWGYRLFKWLKEEVATRKRLENTATNNTYPLFDVVIRTIRIIVYWFVVAQNIVTKTRWRRIRVVQRNREQVCTSSCNKAYALNLCLRVTITRVIAKSMFPKFLIDVVT